jgi:hypothetical protein
MQMQEAAKDSFGWVKWSTQGEKNDRIFSRKASHNSLKHCTMKRGNGDTWQKELMTFMMTLILIGGNKKRSPHVYQKHG